MSAALTAAGSADHCSECGGPVTDPHASAIIRWTAALTRHDDVEVERLVRQSRADRVDGVADRLLGTPPGIGTSAAPMVEAT